MIIEKLNVPSWLLVPVGKSLITWLGSSAIRSIGITYENYFNFRLKKEPSWEFGLRYAFIYTMCAAENQAVPDWFIRGVFEKESAASIIRLCFDSRTHGPWKKRSGSTEFKSFARREVFRQKGAEQRINQLQRVLATLSEKELGKLWRRLRSYTPEKFILNCPKEYLLLLMGASDLTPGMKQIIEKRLKGA